MSSAALFSLQDVCKCSVHWSREQLFCYVWECLFRCPATVEGLCNQEHQHISCFSGGGEEVFVRWTDILRSPRLWQYSYVSNKILVYKLSNKLHEYGVAWRTVDISDSHIWQDTFVFFFPLANRQNAKYAQMTSFAEVWSVFFFFPASRRFMVNLIFHVHAHAKSNPNYKILTDILRL